jgi:5'-methylthioadenosine phosphorylase
MTAKTILILPPEMVRPERTTSYTTPYGEAPVATLSDGQAVLLRADGIDARALIYTAKQLGAERVLAGEVVQPITPLLEPGDLIIPSDLIDLTKLKPFTFFTGKGYGFIKLNPPFCPDLMASLYAEASSVTARAFRGATYIGTEGPRDASAAERRMFRQWGGDLVGGALLPETYLARELELCYAAVVSVGEADLEALLRQVAAGESESLPCACRDSMSFMKEQGVVGEDWRTWIS